MSQQNRLKQFIAHLGITTAEFERNCHLGNGFVSKIGDAIRTKSLDLISKTYPLLNIDWLKTGYGEMILPQNPSTIIIGDDNNAQTGNNNQITPTNGINQLLETINRALSEIAEQRKLTAKAQSQMDELINLLKEKR